jgi:hypothetical protein
MIVFGFKIYGRDIVTTDQNTGQPRLWISYPWVNNEEEDFAYLTKHLALENFEAVYDSVEIVPDSLLWQRIVQRLQSIGFDGWLYVLTHQCISRREYTAELTKAIDQALLHMGPRYPMAGLMYGIATQHVPPVLRALPCISLGDPNWNVHVREVFHKNCTDRIKTPSRKDSRFVWKIHIGYGGNPSMTAIEVHTRGEIIQDWRFAIPKSYQPIRWGQGSVGGGAMSKVRFGEVSGVGQYENNEIFWFGAANSVSISESAYVIFSGKVPDFICFGPAQSSCGLPGRMEIFWPKRDKNKCV